MPLKAICSLDHSHFPLLKGWADHVINFTGALACPIVRKKIDAFSTLDGILAQDGPVIACDTDVWFLQDVRPQLAAFDWSKIGVAQDAGRWNPKNWVHHHAEKSHRKKPYYNLGMIVADLSRPEIRAVFEKARHSLATRGGARQRGGDAWRWGQTYTSLAINQSGLAHDLGHAWNYFRSTGTPWPIPPTVYAAHCCGNGSEPAKKLERLLAAEARHGLPYVGEREHLPYLFRRLGYTSLGVEVGVSKGVFAEDILSRWPRGRLVGVDCYRDYEGFDDPHFPKGKDYDRLENTARKRLAKYGNRWHLLKLPSTEAAATFPNEMLDFAYLGANHSLEAVREDIAAWWPKIRPGGFLGGHDYSPNLQPPPYPGVIQAAQEFAAAAGLPLQHTHDANQVYSWWVIKPVTA